MTDQPELREQAAKALRKAMEDRCSNFYKGAVFHWAERGFYQVKPDAPTLSPQPSPQVTPEQAAQVLLGDEVSFRTMATAARRSRAKDSEGEFPPLFDLLDFSGENKTKTVVDAAMNAALRAIAGGDA